MDELSLYPIIPMNTGFTLIRKRADTYRSQGLHEEALELYAKFVVRSATIDPATKYFIKKQVQLIEMEMNGGDSGITQELSSDQSDLNKKGEGERTIGSDFFLCAQDQAHPPGRNQKDETDIEGADWLDPLADIYALVSNDKGESPSENLKEKVRLNNTEDPNRLLDHDSPSRKCFHRNYDAKSFIKSTVAFVLVGSIFFYFVDWFSQVKKNYGGEAVQKTLKVILKKMPTFVSNEPTSTLPDNGMEELSSKLAEEEAVIGDAKAVFDPAGTQEVIKNLSSPTNGNKTADKTPIDDFQKDGTDYSEMPSIENKKGTPPEEPDPASVIDYVLKKRGLWLCINILHY